MKKRLLITSIVMMLVVAVALSTATYAWFTSNTQVSAQAVVLTASTMDGEAILIDHAANGAGMSQQIVLTSAKTGRLYPATPLLTSGHDFSDGVAAADFQSLIMTGSGTLTAPTVAAPNVKYYSDTFYVFNKGFQTTTLVPTINITYNSDDDTSVLAAKSVRVALIERVGAQSTIGTAGTYAESYSLKGVWEFNGTGENDAAITESYSYIRFDKVAEGETYDSNKSYYDADGEALTDVSSENIAAKITAGLYIGTEVTVNTTDGKKNVAAEIAYTTDAYGALEGTNDAAGTFSRDTKKFSKTAFSAIGVAGSGNQIANEYTVVVWLEGWDEDCTNSITSGTFKVDLSFGTAARD